MLFYVIMVDAIIGSSRLTYEGYSQLKEAGYGASVNTRGSRTAYFGMRLADVNVWNENYTEVTQTVPAGVFADKKVRQAASMIIDQQLLAEKVFNGIDTPAETLFEKTKPYCNVEQKVYDTDSEGEGFEVTLSPAANMMAWYMAGVTGSYDLIFWESNPGVMDLTSTVSNICTAADPVLGLLGGFGRITPELIAELDSTSDRTRVEEIYKELLTDISEEALVIPIVYINETAVWNPDKIESYEHYYDSPYVQVKNIKLK